MKIEIEINGSQWRAILSFPGRMPGVVEGEVKSVALDDALYGAVLAATNTVNTLVFREALKMSGELPRGSDWMDRPLPETVTQVKCK